MRTIVPDRAVGLFAAGIALLAIPLAGCSMTNGYAMNELGNWHYQQGNYTAARENFHRAAADQPQNADYVYNLATAVKKQGDAAGAERIYRQALSLRPDHQPSYHALALLLKDQGRTAEAIDLLQAWADTQPYNAESHVELAWLHREMGNLAAAENALQQSLQADPTNPLATAHLGQLYQDAGQQDRAAAMYQRSLYSDWFQPDVKSRLAALQNTSPAAGSSPFTRNAAMPGRYGETPQVARMYPLPTYNHVTARMLAAQPRIVATSPATGGDPAHAPQLSGTIPLVQPH